jgi:beta-lactamase regulating signal transducer with metallopeptidase domain
MPIVRKPASSAIWPVLLIATYLAGLLILLTRLYLGLVLTGHIVAKSVVIRNSKANDLLEEIATKELAAYPLPRLCESAQISAPVVVGGEGVSILLPPAWREWNDSKLRAVLAHELTHVRRHDWLFVVIAAFNKSVFWFHPLAWWLARKLAVLSEQASDDTAVRITGDSALYAGVLLEMSTIAGTKRFISRDLSALSIAGTCPISRRINRVLESRSPSSGVLSLAAWAMIILCALPPVSAIVVAQVSNQPVQSQPDVPESWNWIDQGFKVSPEDARKLEAELALSPDDLSVRAKLIAYYLYNIMPEQLAKHTLWVIEHRPDSNLAGSPPVANPYREMAPADLDRVRSLWLKQASIHAGDPRVLGNAAQFLVQTDQIAAEPLLKRALELEPQNPVRLRRLAAFYEQAIQTHFYLSSGLRFGPWFNVDAAYTAKLKDQLDGSNDARLFGIVGSNLGMIILHSSDARRAQQARSAIADYAETLLVRAQSLDPDNSEWPQQLRLLQEARIAVATR